MPPLLDHLRRRWFGTYRIEDPRPIADGAPYTYFLPCENELLALAPGDLVKLIFRGAPESRKWDAERMWVTIIEAGRDTLRGRLDNAPFDMPQLQPGAMVTFSRFDVIDLIWADDRTTAPPPAAARRTYWERCLVDDCLLDQGLPVHYLYREAPETLEGDYPDSGWRIRGDYRALADEEIAQRSSSFIAIGKVLNVDDSWLHLIDAPVGAAFLRDWDTGAFVAEDRESDDA